MLLAPPEAMRYMRCRTGRRSVASRVVTTGQERPTPRLVTQRVRNRLIEYLELARSFEAQSEYERDMPIAYVPYEVINQWGDNFPRGLRFDADDLAVYSHDEIIALQQFEPVWRTAADAVPDDYPPVSVVQTMVEWKRLREAASLCAEIFNGRGRLPEDYEVPGA